MLSASKYIGGHSDMTGGALVTADKALAERRACDFCLFHNVSQPFALFCVLFVIFDVWLLHELRLSRAASLDLKTKRC